MLDRADVVAINKFERRGAEDALRDVGRQMVRNREAFGKGPADMPVYGTSAATFNDDGVTALYQELRSLLSDKGMPLEEGVLPVVSTKQSTRIATVVPAAARALPRRDQRHGPRLPRGHRAVCRRRQSRAAPRVRARRARRRRCGRRRRQRRERGPGRRGPARRGPHRPAHRRRRCALADWPSVVESYSGDEQVVQHPGQGDPQRPHARVVVGQQDPARLAAPLPRPRRARQLPAPREPPRLLPLHGRRLPVQARGRGPRPHVRGGGRPVPHQPPLQAALRGAAGHPAVDGVRLGHALRPRPRPAPRRLRQGRHLGCLRRDPRRHEGALRRLRPRVARRRASR